MNKIPISGIVLTYNEEKNIEECLKSISGWMDEVFVVDSNSTDSTIEIAKRFTDKIYYHPFENFASQRNWAQDNLPIKNPWVFHLDADERVSPELALELQKVFSSPAQADGLMMPRRTMFRGRWIKYGGHYPVYQLRIFRKDKGRSEQRYYDQNYIVNGKTAKINGDLINIINPDLNAWRASHEKWTYLEAKEILYNEDRVMKMKLSGSPIERRNWLRYRVYYRAPLFLRSIAYFLYRYIIRLGFLDGRQGMVFHFWQGFWYRWMVDMRVNQMRKAGERTGG